MPIQLDGDGAHMPAPSIDSNDRREPQRRHVRVPDVLPEHRTLFQSESNTGTHRTQTTHLSGRTANSATTTL